MLRELGDPGDPEEELELSPPREELEATEEEEEAELAAVIAVGGPEIESGVSGDAVRDSEEEEFLLFSDSCGAANNDNSTLATPTEEEDAEAEDRERQTQSELKDDFESQEVQGGREDPSADEEHPACPSPHQDTKQGSASAGTDKKGQGEGAKERKMVAMESSLMVRNE